MANRCRDTIQYGTAAPMRCQKPADHTADRLRPDDLPHSFADGDFSITWAETHAHLSAEEPT